MAKPLRRTIYQYTAVFDPAEEGGYTVTVPTLPGCISQGDTFEKALANIKEAASLYLEVMHRDHQRPPRETDPAFTVPVKIRL